MFRSTSFARHLVLSVLAWLPCSVTLAQPPDDGGARESGAAAGIEEIIVTAERRAQSLQDVPIPMTAFNEQDLDRNLVYDIVDIKDLAPNFYLEENLGNSSTIKIYLRGIGQANQAFSFDSPIGLYVDDVYYARLSGSQIDLFDIERIEVLRGPQGTIYGRNNSAGSIRITTQKPPLQEFDAKGEIAVGSESQRNIRANIGIPLIEDELGFRLALSDKDNDGFMTNLSADEQMKADDVTTVRSQLMWEPGDNLNLVLRGDYMRDRTRPSGASDYINNPDNDIFTFESNRSFGEGTAVNELDSWGASLSANLSLGEVDITSVTATRGIETTQKWDVDGKTSSAFEVDRGDLDQQQFTQELFATGSRLGGLETEWIGGVFYFREVTDYVWSLQIFAPPTVQVFDQTTDSIAGYLQGTHPLTDKLSVTAGARYTYETKDFEATGFLADGSFDFEFQDELTTARWTWRAALDYQLNDDVLLYTSAATGFRSGGLNGNAQSREEVTSGAFGAESTEIVELGMKGEFLDRRMRLNMSYFFGRYDDLQLAVVRDDGEVSNTNNTADVNGFELEATAVPIDGLELSGFVGTFSHDVEDSPSELPNAPDLDYRLSAFYTLPFDTAGSISVGTSYSWTDSAFNNIQNTTTTPEHENLDARISYTTPNERWIVTAAGLNLTDDVYPVGTFLIAGGFINSVQFPVQPRRWLLSVQYNH